MFGVTDTPISKESAVKKMFTVSIVGNVLLTAVKILAGIIANSGAMISDAIHSLSDVLSTFVAVVGVKLASKGADRDHPYGHDRFECVASIILSGMLLAVGCGIGFNGLKIIIGGHYEDIEVPGVIALAAAVISIAFKEWMFRYTMHYAKLVKSSAFVADAYHHRSDALSSVAALIGIGGAVLGVPVMEPAAGVLICVFIVKAAVDIFRDALSKMLDSSCGKEYEEKLSEYISDVDGVVRTDMLITRKFGSKIYIDCEIAVDGDIPLREAHRIAENVHDAVEKNFPDIKHIMIHVNPSDESYKPRDITDGNA